MILPNLWILNFIALSIFYAESGVTAVPVVTAGSVEASTTAEMIDASTAGIPMVKTWAQKRFKAAEVEFKATKIERFPSPSFWGSQIIYEIQMDRFNNGDLTNDNKNIEARQAKHQDTDDLFGLPHYRHGGDIAGVLERLDYIKDLGATTLWLTPVFSHTGAYHGYCTADFTKVDAGFGTKEELRNLVKEAHKRNIKVVLDIVVNHMCDSLTKYQKTADHYQCASDLSSKHWKGETGGSEAAGLLAFSDQFFKPFKAQSFFNRCGPNSQEDMEGSGPVAVYGDFVSVMFDFDTRNHDFQQIFTDLHKYWIAYADVDGFRMDAAKHITEDFVAYFNSEIRKYAESIGKNNFFIVGEVAGASDWIGRRLGKMFSSPTNPNEHGQVPVTLTNRMWELKNSYLAHFKAPYPGLNAAYDFAHGGTAVDVLLGLAPGQAIENYFKSDYKATIAAQGDYRLNWNLLEIHDWPRFSSRDKHNSNRSRLGVTYLAMAEGVPIIYYGQEQGFNGDCHYSRLNAGRANDEIIKDCQSHSHALYRQDMFINSNYRLGSTVPEINDLAYIGKVSRAKSPNWQDDPYLRRGHSLYKTTRKMLHLRQSCNGLRFGKTKFRWSESVNNGLFAFSRIDKGNEVLVIMNLGQKPRELPTMDLANNSSGEKWVNLLNNFENAWTEKGQLKLGQLKLNGYSTMVFVHHSQIGAYNSQLETHLCTDNSVR